MSNLLEHLFQQKIIIYLSIVIPLLMAITMLFIRSKSAEKPMSVKRILLPTMFMSTGLAMFFFPFFHVPYKLMIEAIGFGLFFSFVLSYLSSFEIRGDKVFFKPNKYLFPLLLLFFLVRFIIKLLIGSSIHIGETAGMFFILAFSTLCTWRFLMVIKYLNVRKKI